jgi:hypothetical protein
VATITWAEPKKTDDAAEKVQSLGQSFPAPSSLMLPVYVSAYKMLCACEVLNYLISWVLRFV